MSSAPDDTAADPDEDLPIYRAQPTPDAIPGFVARALERLRIDPTEDDFTFEGVDFEVAGQVWLAPIGAYDPEQDTPSTPEEIAAGASPTGPWGNAMIEWEQGVRHAMRSAWGDPVVHTPRLVGSKQEPEGILDYLLVAQDFEAAELWDRGETFVALITNWPGPPGASYLSQVLIVLPRELVMGGMAALLSDDDTTHERLMHGEDPLELRRRAWLMSTMFGSGEVRLRETPVEGSRYTIQAVDGRTTVWTFADDGRQLLLVQDPTCAFARANAHEPDDDADATGGAAVSSESRLILMSRLLDGVPADLRASISARGETVRVDVAEHALEFGLLDGQPVPIISGAFWFDGSTWHTSRGLLDIGHRDGLGMDDYGFGSAVRRPYRLGGTFTLDDVAPPHDGARRRQLAQIFEACPYPEQPRPEGDVRLGYAIPSSADREGIVDAVERATAAWWDHDPSEKRLGDDTFTIGGRRLSRAGDPSVLTAVLGLAEPWTVDALQGWTDGLGQAMTRRWGQPNQMQVHDAQTGVERRTPITRLMRATGLTRGPLWWVNGQAVLLLAGMTDPSYSTEPQAIVAICQADTVLELLGRMSIWETRLRARVIGNLAALVVESDGRVDTPQHATAQQPVTWDGPTLAGSTLVPRATRGGLRAGTFFWVWHFTHDGRGLLTSHEIGGTPGGFAEQVALYAAVPADLLSLVVDAEPAGPYPVVTRDGEPAADGLLGRARSLPDAVAVFVYDGHDWRAPEGMLRKAHAASIEGDGDPLAALYSATTGVRQLQWALRAGQSMSVETLADPEYGSAAFSRPATPDEVRAAFDRLGSPLGAALQGTLNDLLDVIVDGPGHRGLLDAALSNVEPRSRHEISLWLLGEGVDASTQLSFMTPINVLLANPSLDGGDATILRRLLESGADPGFGLLGARPGGHPLVQLCDRDADEVDLEPLVDALLEADENDAVERYDVTAPLLPDGRSLLEYVRAGQFPHQRSRARLLERLEALASRSVRPDQR